MKAPSVWKDIVFIGFMGLAFAILLTAAGVMQGCSGSKPNGRVKMRKVVKVGECYDSWNYGCRQCGVQYDDGRAGRECMPIIGASYPVGDDE